MNILKYLYLTLTCGWDPPWQYEDNPWLPAYNIYGERHVGYGKINNKVVKLWAKPLHQEEEGYPYYTHYACGRKTIEFKFRDVYTRSHRLDNYKKTPYYGIIVKEKHFF